MPISGSTKAPTYARLGKMRLGATRLDYYQPSIRLQVNGVDRTTKGRIDGGMIRQLLDGTPDIATFQVSGFVPTKGQEIKVALGYLNLSHYIFAGHILSVTQRAPGQPGPSRIVYDLQCISYEWLLNRRKVTKKYTATSATAIAIDLITSFTSGFTTVNVQTGLDTVDEITFTNEDVADALTRLARRIGGAWLVDYGKDLHFGTGSLDSINAGSITDTATRGARHIVPTTDLSPVRTQMLVEAGGGNATAPGAVGDPILAVDDTVWYPIAGGAVVSGPQHITYTGLVVGGAGALVGTTVTPSNGPAITPRAATGLSNGDYSWKVTFVTASGETLPSPASATVTMGTAVPAPGSAPSVAKAFGGSLTAAGVYKWKVAYLTALGETLASVESASLTMDGDIAAPSTIGTAATYFPPSNLTGPGTYGWKYTFRNHADSTKETLPSPATTLVLGGGAQGAKVGKSGTQAAPSGFDRVFYRTIVNGATYKLMHGASDGFGSDDASYFYDDTENDAALGAAAPSSSTAIYRSATLTGVPISTDALVTKRRIFRTAAGGSTFLKVADINDNTTTSYTDTLADGSLGAAELSTATALYNAANLTGIAAGPATVTSRKVYRTVAGGATWKLLTTIADNTTTTYTDTTADGSLGASAPVTDTSTLVTASGEVAAGSVSMAVSSTAPFRSGGGWAYIGALAIRYTGVSATALTGIPAAGDGALGTTVRYGVEVIAASMLTGIPASSTGSIAYAIAKGAEINQLITRDDPTAQAAFATFIGSSDPADGIVEDTIQDRRLSQTEAENRGDAQLTLAKDPLVTVGFTTRDQTAHIGRQVTITRTAEGISGTFKIQSVTFSFDGDGKVFPMRSIEASSRRFSFEQLLRLIKGN